MEIDGEERKRDSNGWRRGRAMNGDGEEKERERESNGWRRGRATNGSAAALFRFWARRSEGA